MPAAGRFLNDEAGTVSILGDEVRRFDGDTFAAVLPLDDRRRSRLSASVLPSGETLALAGEGFRTSWHRSRNSLAINGPHDSPVFLWMLDTLTESLARRTLLRPASTSLALR